MILRRRKKHMIDDGKPNGINTDDEADTHPLRKTKIHLTTVEDGRRLLSVTLNELRRGEIESTTANSIFNGLRVFLSMIEIGTMEERLQRLEDYVHGLRR